MIERHYTGFRVKEAIVAITCALALCINVSGCKDSTNSKSVAAPDPTPSPTNPPTKESFSLNSVLNSIQGATSDVTDAMRPHTEAAQQRTKEEVSKLFRWEYRVVELPSSTSALELEVRLGKLGEENWECFSIVPHGDASRITCKRRPESALAYLKFIPGL